MGEQEMNYKKIVAALGDTVGVSDGPLDPKIRENLDYCQDWFERLKDSPDSFTYYSFLGYFDAFYTLDKMTQQTLFDQLNTYQNPETGRTMVHLFMTDESVYSAVKKFVEYCERLGWVFDFSKADKVGETVLHILAAEGIPIRERESLLAKIKWVKGRKSAPDLSHRKTTTSETALIIFSHNIGYKSHPDNKKIGTELTPLKSSGRIKKHLKK